MKQPKETASKPKRNRYVVAMMLGTAMTALGASNAPASPALPMRAVNDISRYCTACWRNARLDPNFWNDCTQEVFCRLLERVHPGAWERLLKDESEERREFLRAIDAVKKRSQRSRKFVSAVTEAVPDRHDPEERRLADDREVVRKAAAECLSSRQQHILQLSFEGWSVHDIGSQLELSPERVSDEKYKAIRKLREHLQVQVEAD
jgi:RNA polymerase sigma factor (sigma-70 family)